MILNADLLFRLIEVGAVVRVSTDGSFMVIGDYVRMPKDAKVERNARYYSRAKARNITIKEWNNRRLLILARDGNKCVYCGSDGNGKALHCDHVIALANGGSSEISNLATACKRCNSSKKDKPVEEWRSSQL